MRRVFWPCWAPNLPAVSPTTLDYSRSTGAASWKRRDWKRQASPFLANTEAFSCSRLPWHPLRQWTKAAKSAWLSTAVWLCSLETHWVCSRISVDWQLTLGVCCLFFLTRSLYSFPRDSSPLCDCLSPMVRDVSVEGNSCQHGNFKQTKIQPAVLAYAAYLSHVHSSAISFFPSSLTLAVFPHLLSKYHNNLELISFQY